MWKKVSGCASRSRTGLGVFGREVFDHGTTTCVAMRQSDVISLTVEDYLEAVARRFLAAVDPWANSLRRGPLLVARPGAFLSIYGPLVARIKLTTPDVTIPPKSRSPHTHTQGQKGGGGNRKKGKRGNGGRKKGKGVIFEGGDERHGVSRRTSPEMSQTSPHQGP